MTFAVCYELNIRKSCNGILFCLNFSKHSSGFYLIRTMVDIKGFKLGLGTHNLKQQDL